MENVCGYRVLYVGSKHLCNVLHFLVSNIFVTSTPTLLLYPDITEYNSLKMYREV